MSFERICSTRIHYPHIKAAERGIKARSVAGFLFAPLFFSISVLIGCAPVSHPSIHPFPPATPEAIVAVTNEIFPAVVRLDVVKSDYKDNKPVLERGIGSGVIFSDDGYILTNFHVAGKASEIEVTLFNKERVHARLVGDDHWTDLAVVQMDMNEIRSKHIAFRSARFGKSATLVPGQEVMAIGTPFGLSRTVTLGSVSTVDRTLYPQNLLIDDFETGGYSNWIQMDVPINPGNSGGPLVDFEGRLVGINTRGGAQNLNFAVPIDTAKQVIDAIMHTATVNHPGGMARSDLGIDLQPMQDFDLLYHTEAHQGVLVGNVGQYSPAAVAGMQPQDVLLSINDVSTNARFPEELAAIAQMVAGLPRDTPASLKVQRGRQILTLSATPTLLQGARGDDMNFPLWGVDLEEVTPRFATSRQLPSSSGVWIRSVTPESPASECELQPGDVIYSIDNTPIKTLVDVQRCIPSTQSSDVPTHMLSISRGLGTRQILLKIKPAAGSQPS